MEDPIRRKTVALLPHAKDETTRERPAEEAARQLSPAQDTQSARRRAPRLLLAEDEPMLRVVAMNVLSQLGYCVTAYQNGQQAVDFYRDHWREIDLVILDMIMPVMGGKDAFAAMHAINPQVVAVLASGGGLGTEAQELLDRGFRGFVQKPFRMEELGRTVSHLLRLPANHGL